MGRPRKPTRKNTGKATGRTAATRGRAARPPAQAGQETRPPSRDCTDSATPAPTAGRAFSLRDGVRNVWTAVTLPQQRWAGYVLFAVSAVSLAGIGAWVVADSLHGIGHWALRAAVRGIGAVLIGLCVWAVLDRRGTVSGVLVLGVSAFGLLIYEAGSAWWVDRGRGLADRTLLQLDSGRRNVESLTPDELADPYIEAYVVMRDVYWELYLRSDDAMSRYRSYYGDYTAEAGFLDVSRLTTRTDLWRSILQIDDLQVRLQHVEAARLDISDLLLTVNLLDVDAETRAAYAEDLRAARDSFVAATAATVFQERDALRSMRRSLEALLDAEGRYRIENGRLIFEQPEDAARFAGRAGAG